MPKYKPEKSKDKLEREVKDIGHKAKDRTKHMSNAVKKDAKAVKDLSKNIRSGGTIEGKKKYKEAVQQTGKEVGKEVGRQQKDLESIVNQAIKKKKEFEQGIKYSKLNYAELTKVSNGIHESTAARNKMNHTRQLSQKDIYTMNSLRDGVSRILKRTVQQGQDLAHEFKKTGLYVSDDNEKFYQDNENKRKEAQDIGEAVDNVQKKNEQDVKKDDLEGQEIPDESQKKELCLDAKKEIWKANAAKEEAEQRAGQPSQDAKQVVFKPEKKPDRNYGRDPLGTSGQNNIYNQKKTYQNE